MAASTKNRLRRRHSRRPANNGPRASFACACVRARVVVDGGRRYGRVAAVVRRACFYIFFLVCRETAATAGRHGEAGTIGVCELSDGGRQQPRIPRTCGQRFRARARETTIRRRRPTFASVCRHRFFYFFFASVHPLTRVDTCADQTVVRDAAGRRPYLTSASCRRKQSLRNRCEYGNGPVLVRIIRHTNSAYSDTVSPINQRFATSGYPRPPLPPTEQCRILDASPIK